MKREAKEDTNRKGGSRTLACVRGFVGYSLLLTSLVAAGMVALQHVGRIELAGCGPQGGCSAVQGTSWLAGLFGWPVSLLGLAYFGALSLAWPAVGWRPGLPTWLKWTVRLGAAGSVVFLVAMLVGGKFCPYCCIVHFANFAFLGTVEVSGSDRSGPLVGPVIIGGFAAATVLSLPLVGWMAGSLVDRRDLQLASSIQRVVQHVRRQAELPPPAGEEEFTGRYRRGPREAAIRLVVFGDYHCPSCREIHETILELLSDRDDLSYSHKHLPRGCFTCKARANGADPIQTAGRAARVAEAAGLLAGGDAFWTMHDWLFRHDGEFTGAELIAALPTMGFDDPSEFLQVMQGDKIAHRVKLDVDESISLGVFRTPAVFVNGVQFEGAGADQAIKKVVEAVAASDPAPRSAAFDRPPLRTTARLGVNQAKPGVATEKKPGLP